MQTSRNYSYSAYVSFLKRTNLSSAVLHYGFAASSSSDEVV